MFRKAVYIIVLNTAYIVVLNTADIVVGNAADDAEDIPPTSRPAPDGSAR